MNLRDSVSSIVRRYNQAADWEKPGVVKALAQLQGVTQARLRAVLAENGCDMTYAVKPGRKTSGKAAKKPVEKAPAKSAAYTKGQIMNRIREIPLSRVLADHGISLRRAGQFQMPVQPDLTCLRIFPDDRGWKDIRSDYQPKRNGECPEGPAPASPDWDPSPVKLGGNVIALVQRLDGLDTQQAVQKLLDTYEPKMGAALRAAHAPEQGTYSLDDIYRAAREIPMTRVCEDNGIPLKPEGGNFKPADKHMNKGLKVWPGTRGWHDFVSGTGGGPIEFMEHYLGMDKHTALKSLVSAYLPQMADDLDRITAAAEKAPAAPEEVGVTYRGRMSDEQRQSFAKTIEQIRAEKKAMEKCIPARTREPKAKGAAR